ncbi:MAG TPA: group III truncated hemoglobin [Phycisphaerales bacterium]|nr:group III truncated hemoglobin [Phycisphaerales bacterium]
MHESMPHSRQQPLPLTEPPSGGSAAEAGVPSEQDIRTLVDTFYGAVREDELLGHVFEEHVADWSVHLPKMYDFWSSVVLHTGRYSGRPIVAHAAIPELSPEHFERWLELWRATVARVIPARAQDAFIVAARRMRASMSSRLFGEPG